MSTVTTCRICGFKRCETDTGERCVTHPDGTTAPRAFVCTDCNDWQLKRDSDPVAHPAHYTQGGVEVIDAIEAWALNFRLGNAVKYIARAGKKDPAKLREDLQKARWYLDREIAALGAA